MPTTDRYIKFDYHKSQEVFDLFDAVFDRYERKRHVTLTPREKSHVRFTFLHTKERLQRKIGVNHEFQIKLRWTFTEIDEMIRDLNDARVKVSIISANEVVAKDVISFQWMHTSGAPRENYRGYENWGTLGIEDGEWIIQVGHGKECILGGKVGSLQDGFYKDILELPECVLLIQKEYVQPFKDAIKDHYQLTEYHYDGTLCTA